MSLTLALCRVAGILFFGGAIASFAGAQDNAAPQPTPPSFPIGEPLTVTIGAGALVKDTQRFGVNVGGDAYYSGAVLTRKRVCENFEGTSYRQIYWGPLWKDNGMGSWFGVPEPWKEILVGAQYTILSGPSKGVTGKIVDIKKIPYKDGKRDTELTFFELDQRIQPPPKEGGLLVEAIRLNEGEFRKLDGYWTSKGNKVIIGDTPPGSFGCAALGLDAMTAPAHARFATHYQQYGETNGVWHLRFWAKRKNGAPSLAVGPSPDEYGKPQQLTPENEWRKHELTLTVSGVPESTDEKKSAHLTWLFTATGGEVLLDDIEAWMEGDANPTVFRDDCVETLRRFNPGVIRHLQMGGNTLDNALQPPLRAHAFSSEKSQAPGAYNSHSRAPFSLHELYELCEFVGAEPWYCLPGTLSQDEMKRFMEYVGAPPDTGYGKVRAQLGHPKPWTETFKRIHVEFGNEAWNNAGPYQCGGFNGPDYWQDLIATGKSSPHFKPVVLFHAAGQAANPGLNARIMRDAPNADRFGVAPYIIQGFDKDEVARLDTDDKLFRWAFAWPIARSLERDGQMFQNALAAQAAKTELSVYEINHHITHGDGPLAPRNRITTSIGGGLNVANTMLTLLKAHGVRAQCLFSLIQHSYNAPDIGAVRLWGTALNMRRGHERYRPTFLACALANKVLGGDLVETTHSPDEPKFSATGVFNRQERTVTDLPVVWSYAFADGARRGLILINLDTARAHRVTLALPDEPAVGGATRWLLSADSIAANNEFENVEPQVGIVESAWRDFRSGAQLTLPPFSMLALQWPAGQTRP